MKFNKDPYVSEDGTIKICDLYLSAYVVCRGFEYNETENVSGRVYFVFKETVEIKKEIQNYFNNKKVELSPFSFKTKIQELKELISAKVSD